MALTNDVNAFKSHFRTREFNVSYVHLQTFSVNEPLAIASFNYTISFLKARKIEVSNFNNRDCDFFALPTQTAEVKHHIPCKSILHI